MRSIVIVFLLLFPLLVIGQENGVITYGVNGVVSPESSPVLKKEVKYRGKKRARVRTYKMMDKKWRLLFTETISMTDPDIYAIRIKGTGFVETVVRQFEKQSDGLWLFTDSSEGVKKRAGTTTTQIPLTFHGTVTEYFANGNVKSKSVYDNNRLISNENWQEGGEKYIDDVFYSVDREPVFLRGNQLLHQHILQVFKESNYDLSQLEGRMVVGFVVTENGEIDGIRIERGMGRVMNNLAVQAFSTLSGKWQPALLNGEEVRFYQLFPINFIYRSVDVDMLELRGPMLYWDVN